MPKRQRSRCAACVAYHKPCPEDCEFRKFFPNSSEIDYSKFFKIVKGAPALRALLNEPINGKHKTDAEKLTVIRAILIEGNLAEEYPVARAAGVISTLQRRIASLEVQMPGTSKMAPVSLSAATGGADSLYVNSFTGMNQKLDPFLNVDTQSFLTQTVVSHNSSSSVGVGGPNLNLLGPMGSDRGGRGVLCDSAMASFPRDAFPASSFGVHRARSNQHEILDSVDQQTQQLVFNSGRDAFPASSFGVHRAGSNQHEILDSVDQQTQLDVYNSGTVFGFPVNSEIVIGFPAAQPQPAGGIISEPLPQLSEAIPLPLALPEGNILDLGNDVGIGGRLMNGEMMNDLLAVTDPSFTGDRNQEDVGGVGSLVNTDPHLSFTGDGNQEAPEWGRRND